MVFSNLIRMDLKTLWVRYESRLFFQVADSFLRVGLGLIDAY